MVTKKSPFEDLVVHRLWAAEVGVNANANDDDEYHPRNRQRHKKREKPNGYGHGGESTARNRPVNNYPRSSHLSAAVKLAATAQPPKAMMKTLAAVSGYPLDQTMPKAMACPNSPSPKSLSMGRCYNGSAPVNNPAKREERGSKGGAALSPRVPVLQPSPPIPHMGRVRLHPKGSSGLSESPNGRCA